LVFGSSDISNNNNIVRRHWLLKWINEIESKRIIIWR